MHFLKPAVGCTVLADIKRQIVFVYGTLLIEIILPDEAALLAVFRNRRLSQKIPVLVYRIQVKIKTPSSSRYSCTRENTSRRSSSSKI